MPTPRLIPRILLREPGEPMRIEMADEPMQDLIESIRQLGILEPILVAPVYVNAAGQEIPAPDPAMGATGREPAAYEVIDGHRRFLAASFIELAEIPVMVFENAEEVRHAVMLHANVCREDVTPYEEGVQFLELATKHQWSMDQLTRFFRKSEDYINDRCEVVRKDEHVAAALRDRRINLGQAKEVLKVEDAEFRAQLLDQAAVHGATIQSLRVMRHNRLSEERAAQGSLPINSSPQFVPAAIFPEDKCAWCGNDIEVGNKATITVHTYHQRDVEAVLEKVGLRQLLAAKGGSS